MTLQLSAAYDLLWSPPDCSTMPWSLVTSPRPHSNLKFSLYLCSFQDFHPAGIEVARTPESGLVLEKGLQQTVLGLWFKFSFGFCLFPLLAGCDVKANVRLIWEDFRYHRLSLREVSASHQSVFMQIHWEHPNTTMTGS